MSVASNIVALRYDIQQLERCYQRRANSVRLLAVSKGQPIAAVDAAVLAGQQHFGENYLQEALVKIEALQQHPLLCWHFIGAIQSNKVALIARNFAWVHGVSSLKIATSLAAKRPDNAAPLNICIQVNISQEKTKSGVPLEEVADLVADISLLDRIRLRGLMVIPPPIKEVDQQLKLFQKIAVTQHALIKRGFPLDTLSMGMSADYAVAIAAGSTLVRLGTAVFGTRD